MFIYKATNIYKGKVYIGQTIRDLNLRQRCHLSSNKSSPFPNAVKYYGIAGFTWEIIEFCEDKWSLDLAEEWYIRKFNTLHPNGYNLTYGGEGTIGYKHSKEALIKMRRPKKTKDFQVGKNNSFYGKRHSEHTKSMYSKMRLGEQHPLFGKTRSDSTKAKIARTKRKKYVIIFPDKSEYFIEGIVLFSSKYNLDAGTMIKVAKGKQARHKGYKCRYYSEHTDSTLTEWKVSNGS